jgi:hypothetical protein
VFSELTSFPPSLTWIKSVTRDEFGVKIKDGSEFPAMFVGAKGQYGECQNEALLEEPDRLKNLTRLAQPSTSGPEMTAAKSWT